MNLRDRFSPLVRLLAVVALGAVSTVALAQVEPAPSAAPSASASARVVAPPPAPSASPASPKVQRLRRLAEQVRAFREGTLDPTIEVESLFDVDLDDAEAVRVEARRLRAVIAHARAEAEVVPESVPSAASAASATPAPSATPSASPSPSGSAAAAGGAPPEVEGADPARAEYAELRRTDRPLWDARVGLDEARLAVYELPAERRQALLDGHLERREQSRETESEQTIAEADREAAEAEKERQAALESAAQARSEAARAVFEEHARLLEITKLQAEYSKSLASASAAVQARSDEAIGERRRITEAMQKTPVDSAAMDLMYVALRARLEEGRSALAAAIDELAAGTSEVPVAGPDPLTALPAEVDRSVVDEERAHIAKVAAELRERERALREERARLLMAEVELLNMARLSMLPHLSPAMRSDATGFSPAGFDHARAEVRQVWLTARYQLHATSSWVRALKSGDGRGSAAWMFTVILGKWLIPIALFLWWRRRAETVLTGARDSLRELRRKQRGSSQVQDRLLRALAFLRRVRRPLEWLVLLWSVVWLLPASMQSLLEVELVATIFSWTLGGALVVNAIDALSSDEVAHRAPSATQTAHLRLRSLQLLGRAVVTVGLILSLSDKLVGKGTIHSWVLTTCWFALIPILLVIVRWWRHIIFERIELVRKKGRLERWVLDHRDGATSFPAAIAGGAYLFGVGAWRLLRGRVVTFNVTRRLLAYLFRRGMTKKASEGEQVEFGPLDDELFRRLGPATQSDVAVPSVADALVEDIVRRIGAPGGGLFAIVGERGSGKSSLIARLAETSERVFEVDCPTGGLAAFRRALNEALGLPPDADFADEVRKLDVEGEDSAVLVDDAHHLIKPMMEGLVEFDAVLEMARESSQDCTWVFAIDQVLWRYLERARGKQPLFDDVIHLTPWTEEGIVRLLTHRCEVVGVSPSFEALLDDLGEDADEIDRLEELARTEANYYRLLWDYAAGNPGVALHFWRKSLGVAPDGTIHVRLFKAPDAEDLQGLPDSTVFVLRAIVQLGWGTFEQICDVTALPALQVKDALRFGAAKGYFTRVDGRYRITWAWFRAITRFLQRRHLIFAS